MGGHEGPLLTMMLHHSQELGLSAEQEKGLRDLRTEFAKESVRRTAEIRVAQIEVYALLDQERWDLAQIKPKAKQIAALEGELRVARLKTLAAGRALLTPQQLEKLKQVGHRVRPMGEQGGMGHSMRGPGGQRASAPGGSPAPPHAH
jgi:Spy/CpxP family protein refolding chaperone